MCGSQELYDANTWWRGIGEEEEGCVLFCVYVSSCMYDVCELLDVLSWHSAEDVMINVWSQI